MQDTRAETTICTEISLRIFSLWNCSYQWLHLMIQLWSLWSNWYLSMGGGIFYTQVRSSKLCPAERLSLAGSYLKGQKFCNILTLFWSESSNIKILVFLIFLLVSSLFLSCSNKSAWLLRRSENQKSRQYFLQRSDKSAVAYQWRNKKNEIEIRAGVVCLKCPRRGITKKI